MKRYWLVVPVDIRVDARDAIVIFREPAVAEAAGEQAVLREETLELPVQNLGVRPNAERARPNRAPARNVDNWGHPNGTVYGFKMARESAREIDCCFEDRELAEAHASSLAAKSPGKQYAVYESVRVYETTTPQILAKEFTAAGELVPLNVGEQE